MIGVAGFDDKTRTGGDLEGVGHAGTAGKIGQRTQHTLRGIAANDLRSEGAAPQRSDVVDRHARILAAAGAGADQRSAGLTNPA